MVNSIGSTTKTLHFSCRGIFHDWFVKSEEDEQVHRISPQDVGVFLDVISHHRDEIKVEFSTEPDGYSNYFLNCSTKEILKFFPEANLKESSDYYEVPYIDETNYGEVLKLTVILELIFGKERPDVIYYKTL